MLLQGVILLIKGKKWKWWTKVAPSSVELILENPHYVSDLIQGRTFYSKCYLHKLRNKKSSDYIVIKNTHEEIIQKILKLIPTAN